MAKNGVKKVEFLGEASHMLNDNILTFLVFFYFSFGYFRSPVFWPNLKKIALKTRSGKFPKGNLEKNVNNVNVMGQVIY